MLYMPNIYMNSNAKRYLFYRNAILTSRADYIDKDVAISILEGTPTPPRSAPIKYKPGKSL